MARRTALLLLVVCLAPALPTRAVAQDFIRQIGQVTITVDATDGFPGGLFVVRLHSRKRLGAAYAIFDGRRAPFFASSRGPRALVPIPATAIAGPATLGIEIFVRRGRQRVPVAVQVAERTYPDQTRVIPEEQRGLLNETDIVRDSRRLLAVLRTMTPEVQWTSPLRAPVSVEPTASFGSRREYIGGSPVESLMDGIWGEYHRGLDFEVPSGTVVQAPGAGTVLLAAPLPLSGQTVVIDHGQGLVSALFHLSRIDVHAGETVEGRAPIGLSGSTGLSLTPHVDWRVYLHGVAIDPQVLGRPVD
jgi:murein DD-endopeptidase MepM/ murein hydrolase activator NlpD